MAQRTVALCNGKYIGIESIFTVVNGHYVKIKGEVEKLRTKSRNNELFCPCGCGSNLILVAGDNDLREPHFRIDDERVKQECRAITEGKTSIDSKIILKCWLDDKVGAADLESRVPIYAVEDVHRRYEFTFISREKKIALNYCHDRVNLSDEKLSILEENSQGIHVIHIVDSMNGGCIGQYPEKLIKVQNKQGYCLLLTVKEYDYEQARMKAVFYAKNIDGMWQEIPFAEGLLKNFNIDNDGNVYIGNEPLSSKLLKAQSEFDFAMEQEKRRREETRKRQEEAEKERQRRMVEEEQKRREKLEEERRIEEERRREEKRIIEEDFNRIMEMDFSLEKEPIIDINEKHWIQCKFCGKKDGEDEFFTFGGKDEVNLGICYECDKHNPAVKEERQKKAEEREKRREARKKERDLNICPKCGGELRERKWKYGKFKGCSNYPRCKYTQNIMW